MSRAKDDSFAPGEVSNAVVNRLSSAKRTRAANEARAMAKLAQEECEFFTGTVSIEGCHGGTHGNTFHTGLRLGSQARDVSPAD